MEVPRKAISYVRVSTTEQVDGASLDNQEERCQEWALRHGILISRTFREEGASAKTANRPVLQEMLGYLRTHHKEIDYLIIYEVDRLARNTNDFFEISGLLKGYGIELRDPSSAIENNMSDKVIRYMKAIMSEVDNDMKSARVRETMQKLGSDGFRMSMAPYGLRNARDVDGKSTVEPIPVVADTIAYILNEFAKGTYTIKTLIELASAQGLKRPNGKPINHSFMGKLLRQPLYAGLEQSQHTNCVLIGSIFGGIVSESTYYRIQELLISRKANKTEGYQINNSDYPLRRFVRCNTCSRPVRGSASTGSNGKSYPRYHCETCNKASTLPDELDKDFVSLLGRVSPNKLTQKLIKVMIVRVWNDELKTLHSRRKQLQKRIDQLEEHKQAATDKVVSDVITKLEKLDIHRRADKQIVDLSRDVSKLAKQIGTKQEAIDYALNYMDNAPRLWNDATPDMKVIYQAMVFPEGVKYDFYTKQFGKPKLSALYTLADMQKGAEAPDESALVISRGIEPLFLG